MSPRPSFFILWATFVPLVFGQTVTLAPSLGVAEAEYYDANEAWAKNDPNLLKDLFTGDREEMRRRIRHAAALGDDAMAKKTAYLDLITEHLKGLRGRLAQASEGRIPAATLKKDLEMQHSHMLDEQERLDSLIKDLSGNDEYFLVVQRLKEERGSLVKLQNDIALRIRNLDNLEKSQQAIQTASQAKLLSQRIEDILKIWEEEIANTARQRSHWSELYRTMEKRLDEAAGPDRPASPKGKKEKRREPAPPVPAKSGSSSGAPDGMSGTWAYRSLPGAWTGYGEPEAVTLELHEEEGLSGWYRARLPVRSGVHNIRLSVSGARPRGNSASLRWTCQEPAAEGEMELKLGTDRRLFVERLRSSDSYIPAGTEVLLPR